jgi:hypothetical protein
MIETGVVVTAAGSVFWHLPPGRTGGGIPDTRTLWEVLWEHRKDEGLGFAHTHPGSGVPGPSHTDVTTFSAVERGLGRRLTWWITNSSNTVALHWTGPGEHDYAPSVVTDEPDWVEQLRKHSEEEKEDGQ